jgi:hypothetical protein
MTSRSVARILCTSGYLQGAKLVGIAETGQRSPAAGSRVVASDPKHLTPRSVKRASSRAACHAIFSSQRAHVPQVANQFLNDAPVAWHPSIRFRSLQVHSVATSRRGPEQFVSKMCPRPRATTFRHYGFNLRLTERT